MNRHSPVFRAIIICIVASMLIPCTAFAATQQTVQPYASSYLSAYNTYICAVGGGDVEIWFEVMGTGIMDEVGTLSIKLYESTDNINWTWKKTFLHESYDTMLIEDDYWHMDCVTYDGVAGRYYKAYVCIWAGKNGGGDTRYMWATSVRAT